MEKAALRQAEGRVGDGTGSPISVSEQAGLAVPATDEAA